jgi:hypothetical protein
LFGAPSYRRTPSRPSTAFAQNLFDASSRKRNRNVRETARQARTGSAGLHHYDFEVLRDGAVIVARRAVGLPDTRAAWREISRLAEEFDRRAVGSGCWTNAAGSSSLPRSCPRGLKSAKPP